MAYKTLSIILIIVIAAQTSHAGSVIRWLWGHNTAYNALCPKGEDNEYASVAMPDEECKPNQYLECTDGEAIVVTACQNGMRFNKNTSWCVAENEVPDPPGCTVEEPTYPKSCSEPGAQYIAVDDSCKDYMWCIPNAFPIRMKCPKLSFFIPRFNGCKFITYPYVEEIPTDILNECNRKDPYTTA